MTHLASQGHSCEMRGWPSRNIALVYLTTSRVALAQDFKGFGTMKAGAVLSHNLYKSY